MTTKTIFILDDDQDVERRYGERLKAVADVAELFDVTPMAMSDREFKESIKLLQGRRKSARELDRDEPGPPCRFDDADILVIDYDLIDLDPDSYLNGEDVAYLARCYSSCGLIVGLTIYAPNSFDLTLKGHPESFADISIGSDQLDSPGLWSAPWSADFRPWAWPVLPRALEQFQRRTEEALNHLDEPVLEFLGFDAQAGILPRSTKQFLGRTSESGQVTLRTFVEKSGNALRPRDKQLAERSLARIAAARLAKWLECFALPGQDILVDAPHLVSRYPSLLPGDPGDGAAWDQTARASLLGQRPLKDDKIVPFLFGREDWLSRPAWFWHGVSTCDEIDEVRDPWNAAVIDRVFCEDLSRFLPRERCREFVADLPSQFARRFVARLSGVDYQPEVRFSF